MTLEMAEYIISKENLVGYNLCENRNNAENEIVIKNVLDKWVVYATDERANKVTGSEKTFESEEEALDNFVKRLRALTFLNNH